MSTALVGINSVSDREVLLHPLVEALDLLTLASSDSIEVDVGRNRDHIAPNEHLPLLVFEEVGQDPRLFLPASKATSDKSFHLVGGSGLLARSRVVLALENVLEEEAEKQTGVLNVRVKECVEAEVMEVSEHLEVLDKLVADLESVGGLLKVLALEELHVDEVVRVLEHTGNTIKAQDDRCDKGFVGELAEAVHLDAQGLQTDQE